MAPKLSFAPQAVARITNLPDLVQRFHQLFNPDAGYFSPGDPIAPPSPEPAPRQTQIQVGANLTLTPRSGDASGALLPFDQLRFFARNYHGVALAVRTRIRQMQGLAWDVTLRDPDDADAKPDPTRVKAVKKLLERPDNDNDWQTWLAMVLRDRLEIDAATLYIERNRGGGIYGLRPVDGSTVKPLIDPRGLVPDPPAPGYQQILWGRPSGMWTKADLVYRPQNKRTDSMYGQSESEDVLLAINLGLRKIQRDIAYWTDGNIPAGLLGVPQEWTAEQIATYQQFFDSFLAGNTQARSRLIMAPGGRSGQVGVHEFAQFSGDPVFDEFLLKLTWAAFGTNSAEMGFTDDVNRSSGESQENATYRNGIKPLAQWVVSLVNDCLDRGGYGELGLKFTSLEADDELQKAQVHQTYFSIGALDSDEIRQDLGKNPRGKPFIPSAVAPLMVDDIGKIPQGMEMGPDGKPRPPLRPDDPTDPRLPKDDDDTRDNDDADDDGDPPKDGGDGGGHTFNLGDNASVSFGDAEKASGAAYDNASTQLDLTSSAAAEVIAFGKTIPDADLAPDGRESDPHITLQYGLTGTDPVEDVRKALETFGAPVRCRFGATRCFTGADHDVVYVPVEDSHDVVLLKNHLGDSVRHLRDSYPAYTPHVTVAYVKPGLGRKYIGRDVLNRAVEIGSVTVSDRRGRKTLVPIGFDPRYYDATGVAKAVPESAKATKAEVEYVDRSPSQIALLGRDRQCRDCRYFDGRGACLLVQGAISADGWCVWWEGHDGGAGTNPTPPQSGGPEPEHPDTPAEHQLAYSRYRNKDRHHGIAEGAQLARAEEMSKSADCQVSLDNLRTRYHLARDEVRARRTTVIKALGAGLPPKTFAYRSVDAPLAMIIEKGLDRLTEVAAPQRASEARLVFEKALTWLNKRELAERQQIEASLPFDAPDAHESAQVVDHPDADHFAKALGFGSAFEGFFAVNLPAPGAAGVVEKAAAPQPAAQPPQGTPAANTGHLQGQTGTNPHGSASPPAQGGHWVTIHHHHVFIDGQGDFHFGGPNSPGISPHDPNFRQHVAAALAGHSATTTAQMPKSVHANAHTAMHQLVSGQNGTHVDMYLGGNGWRLELKDASGAVLATQRVNTMKKAPAVQAAQDMLVAHHAALLQQASAAHVASQQSVTPAGANPSGSQNPAPTSQQLTSYFQGLTYSTVSGRANTYKLADPKTGEGVVLRVSGNGWQLQVHDAAGNPLGAAHRIPANGGGGAHFAKQVAAMMLYSHQHGARITLPTAITGGSAAQQIAAAHQHAGLATQVVASGSNNPHNTTAAPVAAPSTPAAPAPLGGINVGRVQIHSIVPSSAIGANGKVNAPAGWTPVPHQGQFVPGSLQHPSGYSVFTNTIGGNHVTELLDRNGGLVAQFDAQTHLTPALKDDYAARMAHWAQANIPIPGGWAQHMRAATPANVVHPAALAPYLNSYAMGGMPAHWFGGAGMHPSTFGQTIFHNVQTGERVAYDPATKSVALEDAAGTVLHTAAVPAGTLPVSAGAALVYYHQAQQTPPAPTGAPVPAPASPAKPPAKVATITSTHLKGQSTYRLPPGATLGFGPSPHNTNAQYFTTVAGPNGALHVSVGNDGSAASHVVQVHDASGTLVAQHTHRGHLRASLRASLYRVANYVHAGGGALPAAASHARAKPTNQIATPGTPNVPKDGQTGGGGSYTPPPPKLVQTVPYANWQHGGNQRAGASAPAAFQPQIDSTTVAAYKTQSRQLTKMGYSEQDNSLSAQAPGDLLYRMTTPAGYVATATIAPTPPGHPPPSPHTQDDYYAITLHAPDGTHVADYVQRNGAVARDHDYIIERTAAVAEYAEATHKAIQAQKSGAGFNGIHQFAADYAVASAKKAGSAVAPFTVDDAAWRQKATRSQAIAAHLGSEFPKMAGAAQHGPHGGLDPIAHTLNVVDNVDRYAAGLPQRDTELLRLAMAYHDVGKGDPRKPGNTATDHEHPRYSEEMVRDVLWAHGLTPAEHQTVRRIVKWHDAYGDAAKNGFTHKDVQRVADLSQDDERTADLLMRAWQADVKAIPGLSYVDVDTDGPRYLAQVQAEIRRRKQMGQAPPADDVKQMSRPAPAASHPDGAPNLVPKGVKYGELVQKTDDFQVGPMQPFGTATKPPAEVYQEAKANPDLNYARAFGMSYDGATGDVITAFHGTHGHSIQAIHTTGLRPGGTNSFGKGVYFILNGARAQQAGYGGSHVVAAEVHAGRSVHHDELTKPGGVISQWAAARPNEARLLGTYNEHAKAAAALWAGYHSIRFDYGGSPAVVVLDPARIRIKTIVKGGTFKGATVGGHQHRDLDQDEINGTGAVGVPLGSSRAPRLWHGAPRTQ